jgi:ABC-type multidrug transport system fused ATPase/permease subunit
LSIISVFIPILAAQVLINLTDGNFNELIIFAMIIFILEISRNAFRLFGSKMAHTFYRETLLDLQLAITKETMKVTAEVVDTNSSGIFVDRLNKDARDLADIFNHFNHFFAEFLSNVGVLIAVFVVSREMFLFFLIGIAILWGFQKVRMAKYFARDKHFREISEKNTGLLTELVRGIKDIKILNATKMFTEKTFIKLRESSDERYEMQSIARNYDFYTGSIKDLLSLLFIAFGILLINNNLLTIPGFIILYMYQSRIHNLLNTTSRLLEVIKNYNLSCKRVFEIINNDTYQKESFGKKKIKNIKGSFEFKDVTFAYKEDLPVLKDVNFKIKANQTIAFVGKSGSGKTTIFNLLVKLYNVQDGTILIDDININELDMQSIRSNISIITQNPYIFNFSIRDNLNIVKGKLTEKEMHDVCKQACIHDYIMTLPEGYDTVVGEGGLILSGGQRQRLAIARSLLQNTKIILFDEATSALDNETQEEIQQAINNMKKDRTILIIAHRLSTVIDAHRIIVVDEGTIINEGKHDELLEKCKIYKKLYKTELSLNNELN